MSSSRFFVIASGCFTVGILSGSVVSPRLEFVYAGMAIVCLIAAVGRRTIRLVGLFLLCAGFGICRITWSHQASMFKAQFNQTVSMDGAIAADPDVREDRQQLVFRPDGAEQNVVLVTNNSRRYFYGDRVWVLGKILEPENFDDFDYQGYLARQNVYAIIRQPRIVVLRAKQGNWLTTRLLEIKYAYIHRVNALIGEPRSTLLLGILIGARRALPQNILDDFSTTGTSHVIAISGYNISILVTALEVLARLVGRKLSFVLSLLLIFSFVVISGASASVVRAAIMGSLLLVSFSIGRLYSALPAVCAASVAMLIINPKILYWDLSFQLSFGATLGIMYIAPLLERLTESWPSLWEVKSILITTLAATLATLPLIAAQFGTLSLIAPIANIFVLPLVPATMLFGFLAWLPWLGMGFAFIANFLLAYMLVAVHWFAQVPHASVTLSISRVAMVAGYAGIIAACFGLNSYFRWKDRRTAAKAALARGRDF